MGGDVDMKDVKTDKKKDDVPEKEGKVEEQKPKPKTAKDFIAAIQEHVALIEKAVRTKEIRLISRVLRQFTSTRRTLTKEILEKSVTTSFLTDDAWKTSILKIIANLPEEPAPMEVEATSEEAKSGEENKEGEKEKEAEKPFVPPPTTSEGQMYMSILLVAHLIDKDKYTEARDWSTSCTEVLQTVNSRSMNPLASKLWFFYSRSHELLDQLADIRTVLMAAHRTACLRHDEVSQATLLNLLLRNYLHYHLYEQADKLVSNTKFPSVANSQLARYQYYQGKIKAIQLNYSEAYKNLTQAIRKAPQYGARGFRLHVQKMYCIVQLLMGDIPEKALFHSSDLRTKLGAYEALVNAVRVGDLAAFQEVVRGNEEAFKSDGTFTLIQRLRQNVIKIGLRKITLVYSCISLADIAKKLRLESGEDVSSIVAKAIKDGVIDAQMSYEEGCLRSQTTADVYSTYEPQKVFHKRIGFCLNIHNEAVKAMRYPPDAHKRELQEAQDKRRLEESDFEFDEDLF